MKSLSLKTNVFLAAWLLCTGILIFVYFGWLAFPNDMATKAYFLGWLASSNALLTVMLQASRIALVTLIMGWVGVLALSIIDVGIIPNEYAIVFGTLLASTLFAVDQRFVHIASYGGFARLKTLPQIHPSDSSERAWPSGQNNVKGGFLLNHGGSAADDLNSMTHRAMDSPDLLAQVPGLDYKKPRI
ncbi:hypothetical protein [Halomonas sp. KO116]|uniref:hypothetical protein n=1 Tax=Halomonas sp. KO116 TaxID=1504981 RepID=UPI0004E2AF17|nr:hypothetical protein [Halomonas sp. KO116]AJY53234.1 hypothetical protein KO116_P200127 [Halomonas sp. KO116]